MRSTTRITAILATALVAGALTACSPGGSSQVSDDGTGKVVLWYLPEDDGATFIASIKEAFEAANPGTILDAVGVPEDNYVTKVDTAMLANQPPDIAFMLDAKWIKAGRLAPVDKLLSDAGVDLANWNPVAMSSCQLDGATYCVGSQQFTTALVYNKDMFDAAGLDYPSATEPMTIDEFAELSKRLTQPSDDPAARVYGAAISGPLNGMTSMATFYGEDGTAAIGNADSPRTAHLFDVLAGLARDGSITQPVMFANKSSADLMSAGNAAMTIEGVDYVGFAMDAADRRWGVAPPPVIEAGDTPYVFSGTDRWAMLTGGRNNLGAEKFLSWFAQHGGEYRLQLDQAPLDTTQLSEWAEGSESRGEMVQVLTLATHPSPFIPNLWGFTGKLDDLYIQLASGDKTDAATELTSLAPELQRQLDEAWKNWEAIR
ncbi:MAG: extracellular solute-binding protein [Micrococcales bacterium]|nr:extracellular solute-binding protein [Micrococcales bacterium]OJX67737.1 MAG: hypothetical protein BGO94_02670 [Micrococcales bacterium 72-143]